MSRRLEIHDPLQLQQLYAGICEMYLMTHAGLPATTAPGGTSTVTTAPAPTNASVPIRTPGKIVVFAPILARFSIYTPTNSSLVVGVAGYLAFVTTTLGSSQQSSSKTDNSGTKTFE